MQHLDLAVHVLRAEIHVSGMVEDDRAHLEQAPEEGRHAPELVLAPVLVRMIVALRAIEPAPEEDAHLLGHDVRGRPDLVVREEVARRRTVALRREPLARDLVVGPVGLDRWSGSTPSSPGSTWE